MTPTPPDDPGAPVAHPGTPSVDLDVALQEAAAAVGGTPRPGQVVMAEAVAGSLATGEHLLVQAGTGTGKSLAYLVPAILHAKSAGAVVVATATLALQRQLIEQDLPAITTALDHHWDAPIRAAVLKGRHHYVCLQRLQSPPASASSGTPTATAGAMEEMPLWEDTGSGRLSRQAAEVRRWAETTTTGDRDDLPEPVDSRVWRAMSVTAAECIGRQRCPVGEECFAEKAREAARDADIVVTNHAMLALEIIEGIPVLPEHDAVIIDEGHEWIERATSAATVSLSTAQVDALAAPVRRLADKQAVALEEAASAFRSAADAVLSGPEGQVGEGRSGSESVRLRELTASLTDALTTVRSAARTALSALPPTSESDGELAARQRIRAQLDEAIMVADRALSRSSDQVVWMTDRPPTLRIAPLSIAAMMSTRTAQQALVVTSATLGEAPFTALAREIGIDEWPWQGMDVGSSFDHAKQGILYVAAHLPEPGRGTIDDLVLDEMAELIEAAGGRTLALFSSWRAVERAADYFRVRLPETITLLVQQRGDMVAPLIERFREDATSTLIGTVSLWQGVDVPGDACRLVVIDRIPFSRPDDPVLAARSERVEESGGSGFAEVALPRAGMLLAQGVGRLIRGPEDRGVVAVCDPRLVTKGYGSRLRRALPPLWFTTDGEQARQSLRRLAEGSAGVDVTLDEGQ